MLLWPPLLLLAGCASPLEGAGYYWQSVSGHMALMRAARPMEELIAQPATPDELRGRLKAAREARAFASDALALPRNGSYTRYADLGRAHVLWNVFAAPELSLDLERWCFPVAGCVAYRGYYNEADARAFADGLAARGLDVQVAGVPAYSTLGWFDDPLPSTVLRFPETEVARLIFHELAHQVVYVKNDSTFNESFATAVEIEGVKRWLDHREAAGADPAERARYEAMAARKQDFLALLRTTRARLAAVYAQPLEPDPMRAAKAEVLARMRADYERLKADRWQGFSGYDRWFAQDIGNAHLGAVGAYNDRVAAFQALLAREGGDLARFYDAVRALARLDRAARDAALDALAPAPPGA